MNDTTKTALLSVYHKEGIVEFAHALVDHGWDLLSSEGTTQTLGEAGLPVRDVAELVGGGAILGHKVMTLAREVHAGLQADYETDREEMEQLGLPYIDLACIDLYPLGRVRHEDDVTLARVRELTDVGGPAMLRSAAKGQRLIICTPGKRKAFIEMLQAGRPVSRMLRHEMAMDAERLASDYSDLSHKLLFWAGREINQEIDLSQLPQPGECEPVDERLAREEREAPEAMNH